MQHNLFFTAEQNCFAALTNLQQWRYRYCTSVGLTSVAAKVTEAGTFALKTFYNQSSAKIKGN